MTAAHRTDNPIERRATAAEPRGAGGALLACDLDRTLIYSAAALGLSVPDEQAPRLLCVEVYRQQPLSFMTQTAARTLAELASRAHLVPATTRTRQQYARVRLPGPPPSFAVCANGGHLMVDGESDPDWHARVRRRLAGDCAPLAEVRSRLLRGAHSDWLLKERTAEELFIYLVVDRERLPDAWLKEQSRWAESQGWTISRQGRKVYAVPKPLTKSAAVAEVARRTGAERTYAAGDSFLDTDLLLASDRAWRPGHGELADSDWTAEHVTALTERGVAAGERILSELSEAAGSAPA